MEVELGREVDLQEKLNQHLPEGVQILQYQGIFRKVPSLASVVNRAVYVVHLVEPFSEEWVEEWLAREEVNIDRQGKEGTRRVNIRPYVDSIVVKDDTLEIAIDVKEDRSTKVTEVLESLLAPHGVDYRRCFIQRTGQFIVKENALLTPFDVI